MRGAAGAREAWGVGHAVAGLVAIALAGGPASADPGAVAARAPETLAKKDRERAAKHTQHRPPPAPGTRPGKLVNVYNSWTHEWLALDERLPAPHTWDRFLRDHFTNQPSPMEPKLAGLITGAAKHFRSDVAIVVSAFRHPKYNLILRKKGHQVARDSAHTHGNAVDFYLPRIPTKLLHAWAKDQGRGGVGLYLASGFIHMDTGKIRYWEGE